MNEQQIRTENVNIIDKIDCLLDMKFRTLQSKWSAINDFYNNEPMDSLTIQVDELDILICEINGDLINLLTICKAINMELINNNENINREWYILSIPVTNRSCLTNIDMIYTNICLKFLNRLYNNLDRGKRMSSGFLNQNNPRVLNIEVLDSEKD